MAWVARLCRTWTTLAAAAAQPSALALTAATQVSACVSRHLPANYILATCVSWQLQVGVHASPRMSCIFPGLRPLLCCHSLECQALFSILWF